ncbi:MAG: serine hydrolase domain-containing protein [Thermomicrobiales bacterium]
MSVATDATVGVSRRSILGGIAGVSASALVLHPHAFARSATPAASPAASPASDEVATIQQLIEAAKDEFGLRAILATVRRGDDDIVLTAIGESLTGVPATTDMYFRNGAVAISLVSTLMLILVDKGTFALDDTIARWLPDLPDADSVTFRQLSNMTSGYRDYVQSTDFQNAQQANPFHSFTREELLGYSFDQPRIFAPGKNWEYSHTGYQILGMAIEAATGETVQNLMQRMVLDPLGLTQTFAYQTATIPEPVLHAFTSERRESLQVPKGVRFYEESTFWDPAWTITRGAVQVQTLRDFATAMQAVGRGTLLSKASYEAMTGPSLVGFGHPQEGCNSCQTVGLPGKLDYGLGVFRHNGWLVQSPLFAGYGGASGYHPEHDLTVAVEVTYSEDAYDADGGYKATQSYTTLFDRIGAVLTGA